LGAVIELVTQTLLEQVDSEWHRFRSNLAADKITVDVYQDLRDRGSRPRRVGDHGQSQLGEEDRFGDLLDLGADTTHRILNVVV
jgi:hypothetical protein